MFTLSAACSAVSTCTSFPCLRIGVVPKLPLSLLQLAFPRLLLLFIASCSRPFFSLDFFSLLPPPPVNVAATLRPPEYRQEKFILLRVRTALASFSSFPLLSGHSFEVISRLLQEFLGSTIRPFAVSCEAARQQNSILRYIDFLHYPVVSGHH